MTQATAARTRGRRRGHYQRWTAAKKAAYLEAYEQSELSALQFCRERGIPPSTFDLWRRQAREHRASALSATVARVAEGGAAFARVRVVAASGESAVDDDTGESVGSRESAVDDDTGESVGSREPAVTIALRAGGGHEAWLTGLDGPTTLRVVELVLGVAR